MLMPGAYLSIYERMPEFLKRRINPSEYALRSFLTEAARRHVGHRVLDAGAGESRFRPFFSDHAYLAVDAGIGDGSWDYSDLDACADLGVLPFRTGAFDAALNTQVLEHVRDPLGVLREIGRILRPGGRLYLTAPQGWPEHQQPHDFFRFTRFSLKSLLEEAGFEDVQVEPLGGYFHYLGHRLTYVPKILFSDRSGLGRLLLLPVELLFLALFCFLGPIVCYYLDRLDRQKEFTLLYSCSARRTGGVGGPQAPV